MKNLDLKKIEIQKRPIQLVEVMDSEELKKDHNWFRGFLKAIFISQDLDIEKFEHIEMKRSIHSIMHDLN